MAKGKKDEDLALGVEEGKGSKQKLIILASVGAILLLAIGVGVSWYFFAADTADEVESDEPKKTVEEVKPPAIYHSLDPVFIVNLPPGGKAKMLQLSLQVLLRNQEVVEFLQHNDPMVRHNLLNLFESQEGGNLQERKGKEGLQQEVTETLNGIIKELGGPGEIEAVFFTSFVMQ